MFGVLLGMVAGALIGSVGGFLNEQGEALLRRIGGTGIADELFVSVYAGIPAIVATAYGISAVLRIREEETAGRAEMVLSPAETRHRFLLSHVLYGFARRPPAWLPWARPRCSSGRLQPTAT